MEAIADLLKKYRDANDKKNPCTYPPAELLLKPKDVGKKVIW